MISKLDLYKVFYNVAICKSFSKASEELYMTQPAISQSIKQLEKELDVKLFNRTSKGVNLTDEGKVLFEHVGSAISLINIGEEKVFQSKNLLWGELKIGVGDTISKYYLLPYLEKFNNKYPNIKIKIINATTYELCDSLKSGEVDIAICNLPIHDESLDFRKCMDIRDIFVCGDKYKYLINDKLEFNELSRLPLIFLERKSNSRKYVENFLVKKGVKINAEIELGSHDLLLEFAKINLGISCVVKEFSKEYLDNNILFEIKTNEKIPKRSIGVVFLKSVSLSSASSKFIDILSIKI